VDATFLFTLQVTIPQNMTKEEIDFAIQVINQRVPIAGISFCRSTKVLNSPWAFDFYSTNMANGLEAEQNAAERVRLIWEMAIMLVKSLRAKAVETRGPHIILYNLKKDMIRSFVAESNGPNVTEPTFDRFETLEEMARNVPTLYEKCVNMNGPVKRWSYSSGGSAFVSLKREDQQQVVKEWPNVPAHILFSSGWTYR